MLESKALELRKAGATYEAIASQLGLRDRKEAWRYINRSLKALIREPAEELKTLELERLDSMFLALWPRALSGDTYAIDRLIKLMERRAKLLGLDSPAKAETAHRFPDGAGYVAVVLPDNGRPPQEGTEDPNGD